MFDNIGGKIKGLAEFICWVGIIASAIIAIVIWATIKGSGLIGFLVLALGALGSWVGSFFMYGFGQLIEDTQSIRERLERTPASPAQNASESPAAPQNAWDAPASAPAQSAYDSPAANAPQSASASPAAPSQNPSGSPASASTGLTEGRRREILSRLKLDNAEWVDAATLGDLGQKMIRLNLKDRRIEYAPAGIVDQETLAAMGYTSWGLDAKGQKRFFKSITFVPRLSAEALDALLSQSGGE